jgi:pyruvate dehydrogenase E2 component (dihydrolipoamide acetyltransferase)
MATDIIMPQMGESIAEGTITKWLKKVGDPVKRDEPIFEISTDKVDAEIPSPVAGTLVEIKVAEGETVPINTVVGSIGEAAEAGAPGAAAQKPTEAAPVAPPPPAPAAPASPSPQTAPPAVAPAVSPPLEAAAPPAPPAAAAATPEPEPSRPQPTPPPPPPPPAPVAPKAPQPAAAVATEPPGARIESIEDRIRQRSSPLVRKIAQEQGLDIRELEGTGISNRVTKNDILSFLENRKVAGAPATGSVASVASAATAPSAPAEVSQPARTPAAEPPPRPAPAITDRDEVVPMTKIRRITAENMTLSKRTSAHVTTVFQIDYTNIAKLRERHKDAFLEKNGVKLTYLPFIFRAAIQALKEFPQVNASIDGESVVYHKDIHLGMAVALDWGLIVPVIKHADEKSILGLARSAQDLAERARTKRLKPEEIQGGTFTVTNPGVFGSLFGTPIIPQPQVAILGVGTIEKRPVVVTDENGNDALGIRTVGFLALSFDHRLIDGADADRFLGALKKTLEKAEFDLG